jgi:hypothetical protein
MEDSRWIICKDCNVSIIGKEYTLQSSAETWNKRYTQNNILKGE